VGLHQVAFNIDGTGYSSIPGLQANDLGSGTGAPFDFSAFDLATGLGTIQVRVAGVGGHAVVGFFDLDLGTLPGDDQADVLGAPAAGQGWEIDEPGGSFGNIYTNAFGGGLDNSNNLVDPENVAMALSWKFVLAANEFAVLSFRVSPLDAGGFSLNQFDANEDLEVYLSSALRVGVTPVPEPSMTLLLAAALGSAIRRARTRRI
jgi:hypothetical protein